MNVFPARGSYHILVAIYLQLNLSFSMACLSCVSDYWRHMCRVESDARMKY